MSTVTQAPEEMEELPTEEEKEPKKLENEDKEKISAAIQERLARQARKHAQDMAEKEAKLAEAHQQLQMLQQQIQQQNPAQQQPVGMPQAQQQTPASQPGTQPQISPDIIIKHHTVQQKLMEAAEKDPEFADLVGNETQPQKGNFIHPGIVMNEMSHLDNMPAVIKHLKKNSKDYAVANAMTKSSERIKFFNELSDKLKEQESTPRPPEFEPDPDMPNNGSSGQDFDLKSYMKSKGY